MGKSQRDKGARVERECAHFLAPRYPNARRSANQAGGAVLPDIMRTPYWVECKGGKSIGLWAALKQAMDDREAADDSRPILLYLKRDRTPPVIVMLASEWMEDAMRGWK